MTTLRLIILLLSDSVRYIVRIPFERREAFEELLIKPSFRLPSQKKEHYVLLLLKYASRLIRSSQRFIEVRTVSSINIFDGKKRSKDQRVNRLLAEGFVKDSIEFLERESLLSSQSRISRILVSICFLLPWVPLSFVLLLFFPKIRAANCALLLHELTEWVQLSKINRSQIVKELHIFSPYEVDSNYIYFILRRHDLKIVKYPSPGPLQAHNSFLACDELVLSSAYQEEEIDKNIVRVQTQTIKRGLPENWYSFKTFRHDMLQKSSYKYPIAFYSTATHLRKSMFKSEAYIGSEKAEIEVLNAMALCARNHDFPLCIFLHPKEHSISDEKLMLYYKSVIREDCDLKLIKESTIEHFQDVKLAVGTYSTVLFDRLYCGFETCFFTKGIEHFPLRGSELEEICFKEIEGFTKFLEDEIFSNKENFFTRLKLGDYPWFGWNDSRMEESHALIEKIESNRSQSKI